MSPPNRNPGGAAVQDDLKSCYDFERFLILLFKKFERKTKYSQQFVRNIWIRDDAWFFADSARPEKGNLEPRKVRGNEPSDGVEVNHLNPFFRNLNIYLEKNIHFLGIILINRKDFTNVSTFWRKIVKIPQNFNFIGLTNPVNSKMIGTTQLWIIVKPWQNSLRVTMPLIANFWDTRV